MNHSISSTFMLAFLVAFDSYDQSLVFCGGYDRNEIFLLCWMTTNYRKIVFCSLNGLSNGNIFRSLNDMNDYNNICLLFEYERCFRRHPSMGLHRKDAIAHIQRPYKQCAHSASVSISARVRLTRVITRSPPLCVCVCVCNVINLMGNANRECLTMLLFLLPFHASKK